MQYAVVPVKELSQAKERLSSVLSPGERLRLAVAMLDDVLRALEQASALDRIALVTSDPHALSVAAERGYEVVDEGSPKGLTEAVRLAVRACLERGASSLAVIPGDIPLVRADDIDCVLRYGRDYDVVIAPSWDSRGTNTIHLRPPDALELRFGSWSFFPHVMQAKNAGLAYKVARLPRVALDIDTPADLARLAPQAAGTWTHTVLEEMGLLGRIAGF